MVTAGAAETRRHFSNSRLRSSWLSLLILLVSGVFVYVPLAVDPAVHCVEYPCPWWLRGFLLALGLVFGGGLVVGLVRDHQTGSYLDLQAREIVWWDSHPPLKLERISLNDVRRVEVDTRSDTDTVRLLLRGDTRVAIPSHCIHTPYRTWCASLVEVNPSIEVSFRE